MEESVPVSASTLYRPPPATILHVVFSLDPGGTEQVLTRVARALNPDQWKIMVCCLERRGYLADNLPNPSGVFVLDKKPGKSWITIAKLIKLLIKVKPDLLHTHNLGPLVYGVLGSCWGVWHPILHGEHGQLVDDDLKPNRLRLRKFLYRGVRKVHTVSAGLRGQLVALGFPAAKIVPVINGVDTIQFQPGNKVAAKQLLRITPDAPVIGIVGRLSKNKRHQLLLDAVKCLLPAMPDIQLLIAGDGPERHHLQEEACRAGISRQVHFLGFLPDPRSCFAAMDLLVMPSRQEGLSNAVLEAMACGVPVLAHTACGNTEVVTNNSNGWLANLDTAEIVADNIRQCFSNLHHLNDIGNAARQTIMSRFEFKNTVHGYHTLYQDIIGRH